MNESPTKLQERIASLCGVTVKGLSKRSAAALLSSKLAEDVLGLTPLLPTTEAQLDIARQLALPNLSEFKDIASLEIQAEFVRLNEIALEQYKFTPGMWVVVTCGHPLRELAYEIGDQFQISTLGRDGKIYFKKSNGLGAYPSQLEPVAILQAK